MCFVYILKSDSDKKTYVGCTKDLERRLKAHNLGQVKSTKSHRPFSLIHKEEFGTFKEAREKEKFYKTTSGRRILKKIYNKRVSSAKRTQGS